MLWRKTNCCSALSSRGGSSHFEHTSHVSSQRRIVILGSDGVVLFGRKSPQSLFSHTERASGKADRAEGADGLPVFRAELTRRWLLPHPYRAAGKRPCLGCWLSRQTEQTLSFYRSWRLSPALCRTCSSTQESVSSSPKPCMRFRKAVLHRIELLTAVPGRSYGKPIVSVESMGAAFLGRLTESSQVEQSATSIISQRLLPMEHLSLRFSLALASRSGLGESGSSDESPPSGYLHSFLCGIKPAIVQSCCRCL